MAGEKWSEVGSITGTTNTTKICTLDNGENKTINFNDLFKNISGSTEFYGTVVFNKEQYVSVTTLELTSLNYNIDNPDQIIYIGTSPLYSLVILNDYNFDLLDSQGIFIFLPTITTEGFTTTIKNPTAQDVVIESANIVVTTNYGSSSQFNLGSGTSITLIYSLGSWYAI